MPEDCENIAGPIFKKGKGLYSNNLSQWGQQLLLEPDNSKLKNSSRVIREINFFEQT